MKRYIRLFLRTLSISTSTMLMYRMNIVFFLVFESLFLASQFLAVSVGYQLAGQDIAGWTRDQAYLLTAVNSLSHQFFICFFIGPIFNVSTQVWNGQYDYILLKPLHPLASMVFNGQFVISNMPNLVVCLGTVGYFAAGLAGGLPWQALPLFALFVLAGLAVRVALALMCLAPVFLSERMADVEESYWSVASLGRFQLEIYPWYLRVLFMYGLPLGMMAAVPSSVLTRSPGFWPLAGGALAAAMFICVGSGIFMLCLRRYQSVNSGV